MTASVANLQNLVRVQDHVNRIAPTCCVVGVGKLTSHHHEVARSGVQASESCLQNLLGIHANDEVVGAILFRGDRETVESRPVDAQSLLQLVEGFR